jgi:Fe2+ or Zn2+ uptake regulation protein
MEQSGVRLTDSQDRVLQALVAFKASGGGILSADDIGRRVNPRLGRLAATSVLRSLERRGLVCRIAPRDQWSVAKWSATSAAPSPENDDGR